MPSASVKRSYTAMKNAVFQCAASHGPANGKYPPTAYTNTLNVHVHSDTRRVRKQALRKAGSMGQAA